MELSRLGRVARELAGGQQAADGRSQPVEDLTAGVAGHGHRPCTGGPVTSRARVHRRPFHHQLTTSVERNFSKIQDHQIATQVRMPFRKIFPCA